MNKPELITGKVLDDYLAKGYYRIRQHIFTDCIFFGGEYAYEVFWLRTLLKGQSEFGMRTVYKKNNGFEVQIKEAVINEEVEQLFQKYTNYINFETCDSVYDYLIGPNKPKAIFNTKIIEVRCKGILIAVGYFDEGEKAIAAILHFYDPDFKNYSLGKYIMLLSMQYASKRMMEFYYTGYIALGYDKFDYKTYPDEKLIEVLLPDLESWVSFSEIGKEGLYDHSFMKEFEV